MSLLTRLLLNQGGSLIIEELTYTGFQQVIEQYEPERLIVKTDAFNGLDVAEVGEILASGKRPAFIYVMTDGHNPLTVSLSREKREQLVELARHYQVPVIEDDAYGFLNYGEEAIPPLRAIEDEYVFYVGSFSKILAPALRTGWLVVPEWLVAKLGALKEATDIDTATYSQRVVRGVSC